MLFVAMGLAPASVDTTLSLICTSSCVLIICDSSFAPPLPSPPSTEPQQKQGATKEDKESAQDTWDAWKYCLDRTKSVEVLYENLEGEKILSRLHFRYQPDVSRLVVVLITIELGIE